MSAFSFKTSRPDRWVQPRQAQDPFMRNHIHGKILPMKEPGLIARLFGTR